jgi:hypothetical protein
MAHEGLRREVELAVLDAVKAAGPGGKVNRAAIWRQFQGRGIGRSACFDWMAAAMEDHDAAAPRLADATVAPPPPAAPVDTNAEAQAVAAAVVPVEHGGGADRSLPILQHLQQTIQDVLRVRSVAYHADGRVRNSRMVLKAAEEMRKSLETVVKLQAAMNDAAALERFHGAILDVIRQESPDLAQRVMRRLDDLAMRWGA